MGDGEKREGGQILETKHTEPLNQEILRALYIYFVIVNLSLVDWTLTVSY